MTRRKDYFSLYGYIHKYLILREGEALGKPFEYNLKYFKEILIKPQ
ncbi:hypothetical protein [Helicobacter rodentium]|nr:hypothetical protein [Helicobacter rodentium]